MSAFLRLADRFQWMHFGSKGFHEAMSRDIIFLRPPKIPLILFPSSQPVGMNRSELCPSLIVLCHIKATQSSTCSLSSLSFFNCTQSSCLFLEPKVTKCTGFIDGEENSIQVLWTASLLSPFIYLLVLTHLSLFFLMNNWLSHVTSIVYTFVFFLLNVNVCKYDVLHCSLDLYILVLSQLFCLSFFTTAADVLVQFTHQLFGYECKCSW